MCLLCTQHQLCAALLLWLPGSWEIAGGGRAENLFNNLSLLATRAQHCDCFLLPGDPMALGWFSLPAQFLFLQHMWTGSLAPMHIQDIFTCPP